VYSRHLPPTKVINFLAGGLLILQSFGDFLGFFLRSAALSPTLRPLPLATRLTSLKEEEVFTPSLLYLHHFQREQIKRRFFEAQSFEN
jgi:hypothetical protein